MPLDQIIHDGDMVIFSNQFGAALVTAIPGRIHASGITTIQGKRACIQGDEKQVQVPGCLYVSGMFINGIGTLTIKELSNDQLSTRSAVAGKPFILKGSFFQAEFKVIVKAMSPDGKVDNVTSYYGMGQFVTTNQKIKAT